MSLHNTPLRNRIALFFAMLLLGLLLFGARQILAQGAFIVNPWTVDGGGSTLTGGNFILSATVGQPDSGVLTGGPFRLYGGFWDAAEVTDEEPQQQELFLPAITTE